MIQKLEKEVQEYIVSRLQAVQVAVWQQVQDLLPAEVAGGKLGEWLKDIQPDQLPWEPAPRFFCLGAQDACWWLRKTIKVPPARPGWQLALNFDLGTQKGVGHGAVLYLNGREYESFTPRVEGRFHGHEYVILPADLKPGSDANLLMKIYTGRDHGPTNRAETKLLQQFRLVWYHSEAARLCFRGMTVLRVIETLDPAGGTRLALERLLKKSLQQLDFSDVTNERLYRTVGKALTMLNDGLAKMTSESADLLTLVGVGHAHIDTAWTWPYIVSREKATQTFTTALGLIDKYPQYVFQQSQPQLYDYVKHDSPDLFRRIKEAIGKGQWDAEGGMWVEADCNIPSGEGLVRQLLYGRRFFRQELGVESKVLWLVDSFGFPYTLPQIARGCGIEFFVTTKIAWNRYNRMPYTFFNWKGPDGTEIPAYFMTIPWENREELFDTYNATPDPVGIALGWKRRYPKEEHRQMLNSIGWGDGGGGATFEMIEWINALDGFAGKMKGTWERTYSFLKRQAEQCGFTPPVWRDELFLEFHRGTLTTHADLKKLNRRSETALQHCEMLHALADLEQYPAEAFRRLWRPVLLNQFHDVMAGSSAHDIFDEARTLYLDVIDQADKLCAGAGKALFGEGNEDIAVFNTLGRPRDAVLKVDLLEGKALVDEAGHPIPVQRVSESTALAAVGELPAVGYRRLKIVPTREPAKIDAAVGAAENVLENRFLRVEMDLQTGSITSIIDKARNREVLAGTGNHLQFFEDKPLQQDLSGWEIDRIYQEKPYEGLVQLLLIEPFGGSLRAGWAVEKKFRASRIKQEIYLDFNAPVLFFKTWVDWQEHETMLKVAFPVTVNAAEACFDIQFGHIYRPTHRNTLWDIAKFEVPLQKWMDLGEGDYGVSLLNDGKFGGDVCDNVLRLTLLRSSVDPDPVADRGFHEFTYALYPHANPWWQAKTVAYAKELNEKPKVFAARPDLPARKSFLQLHPANLVLETVKGGEDDKALIVRFYESANTRGEGQLLLDLPFTPRQASLCDMEENDLQPLAFRDGKVTFPYNPCQVINIKVRR